MQRSVDHKLMLNFERWYRDLCQAVSGEGYDTNGLSFGKVCRVSSKGYDNGAILSYSLMSRRAVLFFFFSFHVSLHNFL